MAKISKAELLEMIEEEATKQEIEVEIAGLTVPQLQALLDEMTPPKHGEGDDSSDDSSDDEPKDDVKVNSAEYKLTNLSNRKFIICGVDIDPGKESKVLARSEADVMRIEHTIKSGKLAKC